MMAFIGTAKGHGKLRQENKNLDELHLSFILLIILHLTFVRVSMNDVSDHLLFIVVGVHLHRPQITPQNTRTNTFIAYVNSLLSKEFIYLYPRASRQNLFSRPPCSIRYT